MNEIERDRRLDMAWRAASREEPPAALDAAIRATARRALGAEPGRSRNKHWWYPLAAAATVAALAIGIAQMTPPEQVAPTVTPGLGVPQEARRDGERRPAALDAEPPSPPTAAPAVVPSTPAAAKPGKNVPAGSNVSASPRAVAKTLQEERQSPPQDRLAGGAPDLPAASAPPTGAFATAPSARSEPFPGEDRRGASRDERLSTENAPAGVAEPRQPQSRMATASAVGTDRARTQEVPTRSVEEWIRRIRNLKTAGRADEAARELAAFRAAFGDRADELLPADLQPGNRPER